MVLADNWFYDNAVSPLGILHILVGIIGLSNYVHQYCGSVFDRYRELLSRGDAQKGVGGCGRQAKHKLRIKKEAERRRQETRRDVKTKRLSYHVVLLQEHSASLAGAI